MTAAVAQAIEKWGLHRDRYHRYSWMGRDGILHGPLVGVTTPIKIQDVTIPGDLAAWGGRIAAQYVIDNYRGRHHLVDADEALEQVSQARDIGTAVHARIEHILTGEPQSQVPCPRHPPEFGRVGACALLPDLVPPYIFAFAQFQAEHRPLYDLVEFMVVNLKYRYAGTGDIACRMATAYGPGNPAWRKPRMALIDVKTGKSKASHRLQLAGLAAATFVGVPGDPDPHPLPKFQDFYTLLLRPDGYELVQHDVTPADRRHFLTLVKTYRALRDWETQ